MSSSKIVLRTAASTNRRQPLLLKQQGGPSSSKRVMVGEVVGGTAAECVAVCCCCPGGLVLNVIVMAIYKVPFGICRRVLRMRRRRKTIKDGGTMLPPLPRPAKRHHHDHDCSCGCCCDVNGLRLVHPICSNDSSSDCDMKQIHSSFEKPDKEALALEKEMWDRFYSTGFWRSSSRRETPQPLPNNVVA